MVNNHFICIKCLEGGILTSKAARGRYSEFNPYREILENFSKNRGVTQGISWKTFPDFFQILRFRGVTEGNFWKTFPVEFPDYLVRNIFFVQNRGMSQGIFWKTFPINILFRSDKITYLLTLPVSARPCPCPPDSVRIILLSVQRFFCLSLQN